MPFLMRKIASVVALAFGLSACGTTALRPIPPGPNVARLSTAQERESVSITVYSGGFGLVREVRRVPLAQDRRVALEFQDVTAKIQPETVHLRPLDTPQAFRVLEQNYRYDLLSPQKLLEKYVGRKVKVVRWNETLGHDESREAEVLAMQQGVVLRMGDDIVYEVPGRIVFPDVPKDLVAKPTLVWLLGSYSPRERVEVSYLTQGLGWSADYVVVVNDDDTRVDVTGWVTLTNESGAQFDKATLKLVAGDVKRFIPPKTQPPKMYKELQEAYYSMLDTAPTFREESFFEYHLYTLDQPTTLLDHEKKQVALLEARDVGVKKTLVLRGEVYSYDRADDGEKSLEKANVVLEIENSETNHLGMPLPKGILHVYKADKSGARQLVSEDQIGHTPRDEKVKLELGQAFDVVASRKQTSFKILGSCANESSWEIVVKNHKDTIEAVKLEESLLNDVTVLQSSHPVKEKDARKFVIEISVPARGDVKVSYSVRVRTC